jgi:glycosyltransferase involved in cell wall biosynthesis
MGPGESPKATRPLVFWQTVASPHQAPYVRALAERLGPEQVTCAFRSDLHPELRAQGWEPPDYGGAQVLFGLDAGAAFRLLASTPPEAVHIFSSMSHDPVLRRAFWHATRAGAPLGLFSEGRDWRGGKGVARRLDSLLHERQWRRHLRFVLAMGGVGRRWFLDCGYPADRVYDFAYVVEQPQWSVPAEPASGPARLIYVGQLIPRKRVDLLLDAVAGLEPGTWTLDVVGRGPADGALRRRADRLRLGEAVHFHGAMGNSAARSLLAERDVLVLPSRWDGWGAVVNEALASGARVVCSDHCGAAELVASEDMGRVFRAGSVKALREALRPLVAAGRVDGAARQRIRDHSRHFTGDAVADYLLQIVAEAVDRRAPRPIAPWRVETAG